MFLLLSCEAADNLLKAFKYFPFKMQRDKGQTILDENKRERTAVKKRRHCLFGIFCVD